MAATKNAKSFSPERMEKFRERRGLTRRALSMMLSVTEQTLYSWGTGKTIPNADQTSALAMALGIPIDDLYA